MKPLHLAGLNGIRAIAALAVVVSHTTIGLKEFGLDPSVSGSFEGKPKGLDLAGYGVSIFFALSGFLITYLLLLEKDKHPIDVKKFYVRRILRIWPLYYLYFFITLALILFYKLDFNPKLTPFYIFFAANVPAILGTPFPYFGHYWSLGVEEQFYLFWVWVVKKVKTNLLSLVVVGGIVGFMVVKLGLHFKYPNSIFETILSLTRFHCMMIGALGAIIFFKGTSMEKENKAFFCSIGVPTEKLIDNKVAQFIGWTVIFLLAINKYRLASIIDQEFISLVTVVLIIGQINIKNRIINLENTVCDFLGKISYGIYIIHPLVILFFSKILSDLDLPIALKYPLVYGGIIGTTILTAYLSYQYFEKYFLKLKEKFAVIRSSDTKYSGVE